MEDLEQLRAKEVEHMTRHLEESERTMQERVQRLEASRLSLEEELSRVKAAALSERGQAEEELIKAKNQVRLEEVSPRPGKPGACCLRCLPGSEA